MTGRSGSAHRGWPRQLAIAEVTTDPEAPAEVTTDPMAPSGTGTTQPHSHSATSGTAAADSGRRGGRAGGRLLPFLVLAVWTLGLTGAHAREQLQAQPQLQLHRKQQQQQQQQQEPLRASHRSLAEAESTGKALGRVEQFSKELKAVEQKEALKASKTNAKTAQEASAGAAKGTPGGDAKGTPGGDVKGTPDKSSQPQPSPQGAATQAPKSQLAAPKVSSNSAAKASLDSPRKLTTAPKELFVLEDSTPQDWEQRTLRKHGLFSFISYSSYRLSPYNITVVGFGARSMRRHRKLQGCEWVRGNGSSVKGQLRVRYNHVDFKKMYEMMLVDCLLPPGPGEEAAMARTEGMLESREPGHLRIQMDNEIFFPYREDNGYKIHPTNSKGPFKHNLCFCGPPMYGAIRPKTIFEFIHYHRFHTGMDHFFLYNSGSITENVLEQVPDLSDKSLVTLTPYVDILQYENTNQGEYVFFHDCLYRTREISKWIAFHDLDEFIEVPPPLTFPAILKEHEGKPWFTHGCYGYNVDICEGVPWWQRTPTFSLEVMLLRAKKPFCGMKNGTVPYEDLEMCLTVIGHRKLVYNPRMVFQTTTHKPIEYVGNGTHERVSKLRHAHYRGLLIQGRICRGNSSHPTKSTLRKAIEWDHFLYNITEGDRVTTIAGIAAGARECAAGGFADKDKCVPKLSTTKR